MMKDLKQAVCEEIKAKLENPYDKDMDNLGRAFADFITLQRSAPELYIFIDIREFGFFKSPVLPVNMRSEPVMMDTYIGFGFSYCFDERAGLASECVFSSHIAHAMCWNKSISPERVLDEMIRCVMNDIAYLYKNELIPDIKLNHSRNVV